MPNAPLIRDILLSALEDLEDGAENDRATHEEIATARFLYEDDGIQIDDGAAASRSRNENGEPIVWVAAWVLLPGSDENSHDYLVNT